MSESIEVPEGWQATTLGDLGKYLNGRAFKSSEWSLSGRPIIRIQDLTGSNMNPHYFDGEVEDRYVVQPGDFLISWSATLGAYIWDGPEAVLNQHIFRVETKIDKRFHYHLVRERLAELGRNSHGSGMVHVTKGVFDATPVAVPSRLEAQRHIANVIDRAESLEHSASTHLDMARQSIERFRGAVLEAAVSGRLTAEWRERIDWVSSRQGLSDARDRRINEMGHRYSEPSLNEHAPAELPVDWVQAPLGLLVSGIKYGTSQKSDYDSEGIAVLRIPNVSSGSLDLSDLKFSALADKERAGLALVPGDLLMIRSNGSPQLVGRTVAVGDEAAGMAYAGYLMRLRTDPTICTSQYLAVALASPSVRNQIEMPLRSTSGVNNINTQEVRSLGIPLPSLPEQRIIVGRVTGLLALAEVASGRIEIATETIERSAQSVLAKAFRGELSGSKA